MEVMKSKENRWAIKLAESKAEVSMLHCPTGMFVIENFPITRGFSAMWEVQPHMDPAYLATKWKNHPLGIVMRGTDEAIDAVLNIAAGEPWNKGRGSRKAEKVEAQAKREDSPSARAREILKQFNMADKKQSGPFYDACEKAGIDRKLAASVLCIARKKAAEPATIVVQPKAKKAVKKGKRK